MDGGAWWATVHGFAKSLTRLSDFTFTFHFHALEKAMATHSSVLAWTVPGMGEPGGLPSMGSHRVGHDWSDLAAAAEAGNLVEIKDRRKHSIHLATVYHCQSVFRSCLTPAIFIYQVVTIGYFGLKLQFSSVQSLSCVRLFATPWIAARQASLSIINSRSSLRLTSIESVIPSSHLILRRPLLLLPPIPPSIRVFSNESTLCMRWPKYWSFSFSVIPSKEIPGLISFRMDW